MDEFFPSMTRLTKDNAGLWKALSDSTSFTVFCPTEEAFSKLGDKKMAQLFDPRNSEVAEKIGMYHVIPEVVTAEELFDAGGVVTLGGDLPIERTTTGGVFGIGGTEDGGITVGGARVTQSIVVGSGVLHEVDQLVSPNILWRYIDQLRIPMSK